MDREPLPPPFPVGTRVRYVGTETVNLIAGDRSLVPCQAPGLEVAITSVHPPVFGYRAEDGYSVYCVALDDKPYGRIIWPKDAHDWEVIDG